MLLFCRALLAGKMTKIAQSCVRRRGPSQGKEDTNAKRNPPNLHWPFHGHFTTFRSKRIRFDSFVSFRAGKSAISLSE
jgi:hypothetical protein